jgi:hypothetical protein
MPLPQPAPHGGRIDRRCARIVQRLAVIAAEADDLVLDLGLQPRERLVLAQAGLDPHVGKTRIGMQRGIETSTASGAPARNRFSPSPATRIVPRSCAARHAPAAGRTGPGERR